MHVQDYVILFILAVLAALALHHILRRKGGCGRRGGCASCPRAGTSCQKEGEERCG